MNESFCRNIANKISSRKVVIYGAGYAGAMMLNIMDKMNKEVLYFLDRNPDKQQKGFYGYEVKEPEDILYEDMTRIVVIVAVELKNGIEEVLTNLGLREGKEFIYGTTMRYVACDKVDPLLGYSRSTDINGFNHSGGSIGGKEDRKIICLGGSTTDYTLFGIKPWTGFLAELFERDGINFNVLNGGVIGYNSSQELLKLIRDGLEMEPALVISYSGVNDLGAIPTMQSGYLHDFWKTLIQRSGSEATIFPVFSDGLSVLDDRKSQLDSAEYWYRNEKMMSNICKGFSIPFLGILQPASYTKDAKKRSLNEQRSFNLMENTEYVIKQYEKAKRLVNQDVDGNIVDFTGLFENNSDVYIDICHVDEKGNKIIAEAIYQTIMENKILDI